MVSFAPPDRTTTCNECCTASSEGKQLDEGKPHGDELKESYILAQELVRDYLPSTKRKLHSRRALSLRRKRLPRRK